MKKPTKASLYKVVDSLKSELKTSKVEVGQLQAEVARLKSELKTSKVEVSRLKTVLGKVWQSRRSARFWLKNAREEVGQLIATLLQKI